MWVITISLQQRTNHHHGNILVHDHTIIENGDCNVFSVNCWTLQSNVCALLTMLAKTDNGWTQAHTYTDIKLNGKAFWIGGHATHQCIFFLSLDCPKLLMRVAKLRHLNSCKNETSRRRIGDGWWDSNFGNCCKQFDPAKMVRTNKDVSSVFNNLIFILPTYHP